MTDSPLEYFPGRWADVSGALSGPTALFWHGSQPSSRAAVRVLAQALDERGLSVVAPDWDPHGPDGGRAELLASVDFTRTRAAGGPLVLIGWSLGGVAAAGLALRAAQFDVAVAHVVCLGGAFMARDPISGGAVLDGVTVGPARAPMHLFTGTADDVIPAYAATEFATALRALHWPVDTVEVRADHGSIAGARYDAVHRRYEPADDPATRAVADDIANRIAAIVR